jgi:hypothetical protein
MSKKSKRTPEQAKKAIKRAMRKFGDFDGKRRDELEKLSGKAAQKVVSI